MSTATLSALLGCRTSSNPRAPKPGVRGAWGWEAAVGFGGDQELSKLSVPRTASFQVQKLGEFLSTIAGYILLIAWYCTLGFICVLPLVGACHLSSAFFWTLLVVSEIRSGAHTEITNLWPKL